VSAHVWSDVVVPISSTKEVFKPVCEPREVREGRGIGPPELTDNIHWYRLVSALTDFVNYLDLRAMLMERNKGPWSGLKTTAPCIW